MAEMSTSGSVLAAWSFDEDEGRSVYHCRSDVYSSVWGFSELVRGTSATLGRPVVVLGAIFHPKPSNIKFFFQNLHIPYNIPSNSCLHLVVLNGNETRQKRKLVKAERSLVHRRALSTLLSTR